METNAYAHGAYSSLPDINRICVTFLDVLDLFIAGNELYAPRAHALVSLLWGKIGFGVSAKNSFDVNTS